MFGVGGTSVNSGGIRYMLHNNYLRYKFAKKDVHTQWSINGNQKVQRLKSLMQFSARNGI